MEEETKWKGHQLFGSRRERERERERDGLNEELKVAKGLIAELTPPHAQSAWGFRGKGFELWGQQHVVIISKKKKKKKSQQ